MTAADRDLTTERLAHVRWIVGGTGAGKSTLARSLADRYDVVVHDGDRAGPDRLARCDPRRHPHLAVLRDLPPGGMWLALDTLVVDGSVPVRDLADRMAIRFGLGERRREACG